MDWQGFRHWAVNILIGIDQLANSIILGYPDESISSRAGKWIRKNSTVKKGGWYWLCRALHWIDKNHCIDAIEEDEGDQLMRRWRKSKGG